MRDRKRILSFLLALVMALVIVPFGKMSVSWADTVDLMTPTLSDDGLLKWDPSVNDVYLTIEGESYVYSIIGGSSYNLNDYFMQYSYRSTDRYIELFGKIGDEYQLMWSGTFHYEAPYGILGTPVNIVLNEDYVLSWDPVEHATKYCVYVCDSSGNYNKYCTKRECTATELFVGTMLTPGYSRDYQFAVVAYNNRGYQMSDGGKSGKYTIHWQGQYLMNVEIGDDGVMSWDAVNGAVKYKICVKNDGQMKSFFCDSTSVNIDEQIRSLFPDKVPGFFKVSLQAYSDTNPISDIRELDRAVDVIYYDLYIMGEQVTNVNLDVYGNGDVVFDPQTNTLHLNLTADTMQSDENEWIEGFGLASFVKANIDLTIDGSCVLPASVLPYTLFESTKKITFAEDFVLNVTWLDSVIQAADIEFLGGTYDIKNSLDDAIVVQNSIVIHNGITSLSVTCDSGCKTMVAKNGTITLDNVVIETPSGAMISSDGHRIVASDGQTDPTEVVLKPDPNYVPVTPDPDPVTPDPDPVTPDPQPATPDPQPVKEPSFEEFIDRLYLYALLREPEADGKAFWMNKVLNEGFTGGRCAYGFLVEAQEFLNRDLTNEQFIDTLYQIFFDRAPDEGGKAFWLSKFAEGMTRAQMVNGFIDSTEWCNLCASYGVKSGAPNAKAEKPSNNAIKFATRLYTECLGREYDADGLQFWALRLTNLESSGYEAALGFFTSEEFTQKGIGDDEFIHRLYRTFMGRDEDEGGFAFWKSHLGVDMTREDLIKGFAQSQEFTNICNQYGIDRGEI